MLHLTKQNLTNISFIVEPRHPIEHHQRTYPDAHKEQNLSQVAKSANYLIWKKKIDRGMVTFTKIMGATP